MELFDGTLCLLTDLVFDQDDRGERSADGKAEVRVLLRKGFKLLLLSLRNHCLLILKDEVVAADPDLLTVDHAGNTVCHDVLHLGVPLLVGKALLLCLLHHGVGNAVGEVLLQAGGKPQHLLRIVPAKGDNLPDLRAGLGQGAGLVKDDGLRVRKVLHEPAALDADVMLLCLPHCGEDRDRHREL